MSNETCRDNVNVNVTLWILCIIVGLFSLICKYALYAAYKIQISRSCTLTLHRSYWLAWRFLRTNHRPYHSLYNCVPKCSGLSSWTSCLLKMGPIGWRETSVNNQQCTLRNIPEEGWSHLRRGGSLNHAYFRFKILNKLGLIMDEYSWKFV
jgi:hypothetical protein